MAFAQPRFGVSETELAPGTRLLAVSGEIHVTTAPKLGQALNEAIEGGATRLVVDLADVDFIDSTGLGVLLTGLRGITRRGGRMAIACTNPTVLRLFVITRLDATFEMVATREQALRAVGAEP